MAEISAFASTSLASGAYNNVGRNRLHNGLFNVQQRGVGPWNTNATLTLDRWEMYLSLDAFGIQSVTFADAQRAAIGDEAAVTGMQANVTGNAGAGAFSFVGQKIESMRRLAGKTVTVSLWAYATAGTPKIGVGLMQYTGTGGSPSAPQAINAIPLTLSTTPTRYSATFAVPSSAGLTLGTNGDDATWPKIFFSSGATNNAAAGGIGVQSGTFVLWGVQLEVGSVATPLEKLDPQVDLTNCQHFYATDHVKSYGAAASGAALVVPITLPTAMRALPTCTGNWITNPGITSPTVTGLSGGIILLGGNQTSTSYGLEVVYTASADL
jgi:hypothetical protein